MTQNIYLKDELENAVRRLEMHVEKDEAGEGAVLSRSA